MSAARVNGQTDTSPSLDVRSVRLLTRFERAGIRPPVSRSAMPVHYCGGRSEGVLFVSSASVWT